MALTALWRDLGLEPQSIVGQSVGEVAAAHAAGCVSLADAVKIVFHRSRLLATVTGGKMVVVRNLSVEQVREGIVFVLFLWWFSFVDKSERVRVCVVFVELLSFLNMKEFVFVLCLLSGGGLWGRGGGGGHNVMGSILL